MQVKKKVSVDDLLNGCQQRDPRSQELLYNLLAAKMLGVCIRYSRDKAEAEDILQNGFIKVFTKISDFKGEGSLEGWIRRVIVNTAIESYRKNQRIIQGADIENGYEAIQHTFSMDQLETKDLLVMIRQLPVNYRMVFNLFAIEGYSHREISIKLGISEGASKTQLSRARDILKERLSKMEGLSYAG